MSVAEELGEQKSNFQGKEKVFKLVFLLYILVLGLCVAPDFKDLLYLVIKTSAFTLEM